MCLWFVVGRPVCNPPERGARAPVCKAAQGGHRQMRRGLWWPAACGILAAGARARRAACAGCVPRSREAAPGGGHARVTLRSPWSDTPTVFHKFHFHMTLERKKQTPVCMFLSKRGRPTGGKKWTWTRPFARPRPSSTSDEGGSAVPNSRLITAVIWISRIPMDITGPLGSTQTTTTATAMRQKTRPPRNQTRAEWEMEWKARRKRWELWSAKVSIMSGELRSSSGFAVVTRRTAPVG